MKILVAAVALSALIASPILAASGPDQAKAAQARATKHTAKHVKPVRAAKRVQAQAPQPFSPFVHRPEYDVYVNGVYAGSDPDPRIRWTLKREYCETTLDGC